MRKCRFVHKIYQISEIGFIKKHIFVEISNPTEGFEFSILLVVMGLAPSHTVFEIAFAQNKMIIFQGGFYYG